MQKSLISLILFLSFISYSFSQKVSDLKLHPSTKTTIIKHKYYQLEYSEEHEQALWVYYTLSPENISGLAKRKNNFKSDPKVSTKSAAKTDYVGSGYDRGHLCPAASMSHSQAAMDESFYMSNMTPQAPGLNRGKWKQLEAQVRNWTMKESKLHIVSGPIFKSGSKKIGKSKVSVPAFFYKVIYDPTGTKKMIAFIVPNKKLAHEISYYKVSVDKVEEATGIDFFPAMIDKQENELESKIGVWNFRKKK